MGSMWDGAAPTSLTSDQLKTPAAAAAAAAVARWQFRVHVRPHKDCTVDTGDPTTWK
ncbi:hypothetical protein E4U43_000897 [Claviceps pusilla]|uniref:Uncharacterized protein n=1 Tax=Claviceps pusilla TaxID=123648 RepID=A0A9P7SZM8_9HYPO|nr:hypothetical protein E4U43_000897 [Claviceps pusilla]